MLLDAMAVIHPARPGVTLDVIGDGPDRAAYEARENLPCVAIEAAASGLRVIASDVGGTSEVVSPAVGVLVPAEDPATLAAARLARERYGAEAVARRWTELYATLPRRRRDRHAGLRSRC